MAAGPIGTLYRLGTVGEWSDGRLLGRFLDREDAALSDTAFAAMVDRHGPMVLRVCRRILGDSPDAHDAFQATFLILVRKAGSIRDHESVGDWLFRIARRVAVRARVDADRRRRRLEALESERRLSRADADRRPPGDRPDGDDLIAEVDRLPARYREAVVLHYFEGLSTEAAARRLGCARGTVLSRLSRARQRLRGRLERRGMGLEVSWPFGIAVDGLEWGATVPPALVQGTIRAAASLNLAGATIESVVPATVAGLARGAARTLVVSRLRAVACLLILLFAAGVSIGLVASLRARQQPARPASPGQAMPGPAGAMAGKGQASQGTESVAPGALVCHGVVLDPDGILYAGASIIASSPTNPKSPEVLATSGAYGRFKAAVPADLIDQAERDDLPVYLAAVAPGCGPGWVKIDRQAATKGQVTIRLVRDDVVIEGRIIDLEGRGVPGLTVSRFAIAELPDRFLARLQSDLGRADGSLLWDEILSRQLALERPRLFALASVRTGPDGRFRVRGVGRDRVVGLVARGDAIVETYLHVVTTTDPAYRALPISGDDSGGVQAVRAAIRGGGRPRASVEGIVRDHDTGRPIAGAKVESLESIEKTTSDSQGRFRLGGMPTGSGKRTHSRRRGSALRQGLPTDRRHEGPCTGRGATSSSSAESGSRAG